ncbi:MAG: hypothetical protein JST86_19675 [Bacteroidetes bacterium]|nr:hypothetical protein [Bacteroidota bacterium]
MAKAAILFLYLSVFIVQGVFSHAILYNKNTNRYEYCKKPSPDQQNGFSKALIQKHNRSAVVRVNKRFQLETAPAVTVWQTIPEQIFTAHEISIDYPRPFLAVQYCVVVILRGPPVVA